jgi:hypothetical protein
MATGAVAEGAGVMELLSAGFDKAEAAIDGEQFGAQAEDTDIKGSAAL